MASGIQILGDHPFAKDPSGKLKSRIATIFPYGNTIVTLPGIHALHRQAYVNWLNQQRQASGLWPLSPGEASAHWHNAVDLIVQDETILIRPDPANMPLAFEADQLLEDLVPKHKIRFLYVRDERVRNAVKRRGECWRITPLPTSCAEMKQMIAASKIGIRGRDIYYYNNTTGTRFLTLDQFARLAALGEDELRQHLCEIQEFSGRLNYQGNAEIGFFMADRSFSKKGFAGQDFALLGGDRLQAAFAQLRQKFQAAVQPAFWHDDFDAAEWRNQMFAALIGEQDETISEETLLGLSPEFFMQIRWLPGGQFVRGEFVFDQVYEENPDAGSPGTKLCDENAREFIYNLIREYGELDYVNLGRVVNSLSRRSESRGRRDVYIAEIKQRGSSQEVVSIIRMQKWGVREHLEKGMSLLQAIYDSEDYTEYVLDRRFGCRQLGMNLTIRVTARKIAEKYVSHWTAPEGITIWSPYFERPYVRGIATDKMPRHRFENEAFALQFARLLGMAAAPNLIVGRCDIKGKMLFDDGDEVVIEDDGGMPVEIIVADQTGTFNNYHGELDSLAPAYADPINRRAEHLPDPHEFARVYLDAFAERFAAIQQVYRSRKRAFHAMFANRRYDKEGSFAYRWDRVLKRLDRSDPQELRELIRKSVVVPQGRQAAVQLQS